MDGTLTVENGGTIYDFIDLASWNMDARAAPPAAPVLCRVRQVPSARSATIQSGASLARRTSPITMTLGAALRAFPRRGPPILLRLFPQPRGRSRDRPAQQEAPSRRQAAAASPANASRYRLGLGGARALPRPRMRCRRHRPHPLGRAAQARDRARRRSGHCRIASASTCATIAREKGTYDRIVSVGMFEHVGIVQFQTFFDTVRGLLNEDGVALVHAIGRGDGARA